MFFSRSILRFQDFQQDDILLRFKKTAMTATFWLFMVATLGAFSRLPIGFHTNPGQQERLHLIDRHSCRKQQTSIQPRAGDTEIADLLVAIGSM